MAELPFKDYLAKKKKAVTSHRVPKVPCPSLYPGRRRIGRTIQSQSSLAMAPIQISLKIPATESLLAQFGLKSITLGEGSV
jgi:hypothetical protein